MMLNLLLPRVQMLSVKWFDSINERLRSVALFNPVNRASPPRSQNQPVPRRSGCASKRPRASLVVAWLKILLRLHDHVTPNANVNVSRPSIQYRFRNATSPTAYRSHSSWNSGKPHVSAETSTRSFPGRRTPRRGPRASRGTHPRRDADSPRPRQ